MTDAELIVASCADPARFREIYDRRADELLAYLYRRTFDAEVAADLLAETFAAAFERRGRFRDTGTPGVAWLYGIAAKELSHFYRRRSVELRAVRRLGVAIPALDDESIARIEALADSHEARSQMSAALTRLPNAERDAVRLRVIDELDYETIAVQLRCSEGAARTRVHRGLARLRRHMGAQA